MKSILPLAILLLVQVPAPATTIYVPDHHSSIQDAIDAARSGDSVIVRPGTYPEAIDFLGKDITVRSERGPGETCLAWNRTSAVVTFENGETERALLEGFTIRNGDSHRGGGVFVDGASPTLRNNVIIGNRSSNGAGLHLILSSARIVGNVISGNEAISGGGLYCRYSSPRIEGNLIADNSGSLSPPTAGVGGGIACDYYSHPVIVNNIITGNRLPSSAGRGGGIACATHSTLVITGNTIVGNSARRGGAVYAYFASALIANSILWDGVAPDGQEISIQQGLVMIDHSDVKGGKAAVELLYDATLDWGPGMIDADPLFVVQAARDFHIPFPSPCRNAGRGSAPFVPSVDFEGDPRVFCGCVDIGADEFHAHLYGVGAPVPGSPVDIRIVAPPTASVRIALGSGLRQPALPTPWGELRLLGPPLWSHLHHAVPSRGWIGIPMNVPGGASPGERYHFQAFVGSAGAYPPVLTNVLTLTVE